MSYYVTQGTVQVELKTKAKADAPAEIAVIFINPTPGFSVKPGKDKEDYIVFVHETILTNNIHNAKDKTKYEAKVFKNTQGFQTNNPVFITKLTQAAFEKTNIEIKISKVSDKQPQVVSVKIPATP